MTEKDDNLDKLSKLFGMAETTLDTLKENEDVIRSVIQTEGAEEGGKIANLQDADPLREAHIREDEVLIVLQHSDEPPKEVSAELVGGVLTLKMSDQEFVAEVPDDIELETMETNYSNGVFEVSVERGGE